VLAEHGIVKTRHDGAAKQPFVPYETVALDITGRAPAATEESKPFA